MIGPIALPISFSPEEGERLVIIGDPERILFMDGNIDPDQLWFDFLPAVLFVQRPVKNTTLTPEEHKKLLSLQKQKRKQVAFNDERATVETNGQRNLPFSSFRVSNKDFRRLRNKDFPGWERTPAGEISHITAQHNQDNMKSWLNDECRGLFHLKETTGEIYFELISDATKAMLMFG